MLTIRIVRSVYRVIRIGTITSKLIRWKSEKGRFYLIFDIFVFDIIFAYRIGVTFFTPSF